MSEETVPQLNEEASKQVEMLIGSNYPEGLVRKLEGQYRLQDAFVEDAVARAMLKLVVRDPSLKPVADPGAYVYRVAVNDLNTQYRRAKNLGIDLRDPSTALSDGDRKELRGVTDEELAEGRRAYEVLKEHVEGWENMTMRVVTLIFLEAAYLNEVVTLEDAAALVEDITGHSIGITTVFRKRNQGFERLQDFIEKDYIG